MQICVLPLPVLVCPSITTVFGLSQSSRDHCSLTVKQMLAFEVQAYHKTQKTTSKSSIHTSDSRRNLELNSRSKNHSFPRKKGIKEQLAHNSVIFCCWRTVVIDFGLSKTWGGHSCYTSGNYHSYKKMFHDTFLSWRFPSPANISCPRWT